MDSSYHKDVPIKQGTSGGSQSRSYDFARTANSQERATSPNGTEHTIPLYEGKGGGQRIDQSWLEGNGRFETRKDGGGNPQMDEQGNPQISETVRRGDENLYQNKESRDQLLHDGRSQPKKERGWILK